MTSGQHATTSEQLPPENLEEPISIVVPEGAAPGIALHHKAPDGQDLRLTIPEGVPAGSVMTLTRDPVTKVWRCIAEPAETPRTPDPAVTSAAAPMAYSVPFAAEHHMSPAMLHVTQQAQSMTIGKQAATPHMPVNLSYVPPPAPQSSVDWRPSYTPPSVVLQQGSSYVPPALTVPTSAPQASIEGKLSYTPPPVLFQQSLSYVPPPVTVAAPAVQSSIEQRSSYTPPPVLVQNQLSYRPPPVTVLEQRTSYTPLPRVLHRSITPIPRISGQVMATTVKSQPEHITRQVAGSNRSPYPSYVPPAVFGGCQTFNAYDSTTTSMAAPYMNLSAGMAGLGPSITTLPPQEQPAMMTSAPPMGALSNVPMMGTMPSSMGISSIELPPIGLDLPPLIRPQIGLPGMNMLSGEGTTTSSDPMQMGLMETAAFRGSVLHPPLFGGVGNLQTPFMQSRHDINGPNGVGLNMAHGMDAMTIRSAVQQAPMMAFG